MLNVLGLSLAAATAAENSTGTLGTCTAVRDDVRVSARVTCHFSRDVNSTLPVSLSVDFYPEGKSSPITLIECDWQTRNDSCKIQKGRYSFSVSPAVASDMVLHIANDTEKDAGRYVCHMLSRDKSATTAACELTSKDSPTRKTTEDTTTLSDGTDGGKPKEASSDTAVIVGIVVPVAILVIVAVAALLWRNHHQSRGHHEPSSGDTPEGQPLQNAGKSAEKPVDSSGVPGNDTPNMADRSENTAPAVIETSETEALDSAESPKPETGEAEESAEDAAPEATGIPDHELPNDADAAGERDRLLLTAEEGSGDDRQPNPLAK